MAGLDFDGTAALVVIISAACLDSTPWLGSMIYLLRCHFPRRTLGFGIYWSHAHDLYDNRTARVCFFGRQQSRSVQAI